MQGNIDFSGTLSGSIAGGGSGGSNVTITPTLQSGTKIADYTIDETSGSLYAPTPEGLTAELPLVISNNTISIDLSNYVTSSALETVLEDYPTYTYTESRYTPLATFNAYTISAESHFQRTLTAGTNITIDPVTDTISASGGSIIYSTTEQVIGTWFGKTLYQKSEIIDLQTPISAMTSTTVPISQFHNIYQYINIEVVGGNKGASDDVSNWEVFLMRPADTSDASGKYVTRISLDSEMAVYTGANYNIFPSAGVDNRICRFYVTVKYTKPTD